MQIVLKSWVERDNIKVFVTTKCGFSGTEFTSGRFDKAFTIVTYDCNKISSKLHAHGGHYRLSSTAVKVSIT